MELFKIHEPLNEGKILDGMYQYQKHLIGEYQKRDLLPRYVDLDINSQRGQAFIKSLIQNFVEELAEADQIQDRLVGLVQQPNLSGFDSDLYEKYAEELADSIHFILEIMVYMNIDPDDVSSFYRTLLQDKDLLALYTTEPIMTSFRYGRHLNIFENSEVLAAKNISMVTVPDSLYEEKYYAGRYQHPYLDIYIKRYSWEITKRVSLAANFLKLRPWVQGERPFVNVLEFQREIMYTWVGLFAMLDLIGWDEKGIYHHYEKKNLKNQQRIIDKY